MPSLDQQQFQAASEEAKDQPVNGDDVELLTRMAIKLMSDGGLDVIKTALQESQDPAQVVGQFMVQLISQLAENVGQQVDIDMRAFLAKGGVLENLLDYIEEQLGYPAEFSDQIYGEVVEMIKAAATDPEPVSEGGPPPPAPQGQPPQGGPPQGGPPPQQGGY